MSAASRVGRKPVIIPSGVNVSIENEEIAIAGPKGRLSLKIHPFISIVEEESSLKIELNSQLDYCRKGSGKRLLHSISGTMRSKISNAVVGVTKGFERKLVLVGVGYRAQVKEAKNKILNLTIGYSHPVDFVFPEGITIETPTQTEILIKGVDKHLVGYTAAEIMSIRPPEPYKGKGIINPLKPIKRKETKKK